MNTESSTGIVFEAIPVDYQNRRLGGDDYHT
jgi:hypothetical protein